jgi:Fe-S-cluster containining protein
MKQKKKEFTIDICLECSKKYGGCCTVEPFVPVTIKDIERMEKLGYKKEFFLTLKRYSKKDIVGPEKWWINSFIDIKGVKYKINLKRKGKRCVFLENRKGCVLGNKRPFFCKIYPFWVENNKVVVEKGDGIYCNIYVKGSTISEGMKIMKENPNRIKKYFLEIKNDSIKNKKKHEKIASSIKIK